MVKEGESLTRVSEVLGLCELGNWCLPLPGCGGLPKLTEKEPQTKVSKKTEEIPTPLRRSGRERIFMVPKAPQKKHRVLNGRHEFWD